MTDIDLAGFERPGAGTGLRVVTDVSPPRFRLRYTLTRRAQRPGRPEDRPVQAGGGWRRRIRSSNQPRSRSRSSSASTLAYERDLLRGWFEDRILRRQPPPA
jgi:hypothetical protein